jgi:serine/threonine protein kinase
MPPTVPQHPSTADLTAFANGRLAPSAATWVRSHLDECAACRAAVDGLPGGGVTRGYADTPSDQVTRSVPPPADLADLPPALREHPRYRAVKLLGRGGMGVVYLAEHRVMERLVAIKVISRVLVDRPEALERFHREVRTAAKLDHPNIVKAYDAEQAGDLQLLAMEFVEGKSLADVLTKKGPLPIANACNYVRQAALGLQHAFDRGMVHRDLKPQNLMLTPKGVVKILDFGLAKLASEQARPGGGLTLDNTIMGTPEYMAPEQAANSKTADVRADIYALGCTLYCLLAGRPPFRGEFLAVVVAHANDAPPPLLSLRPDVPPELAASVERMLAKNPADRPQTPKEVVETLGPFAKPPVKAPPAGVTRSWPGGPAPRPPRRHWLIPTALAVLVAGGLAAAVIVMSIKTPDGIVRLEITPPDAKVEVAEGAILVRPKGDNEPYEITVSKGGGRLRISKAGFEITTREVTLNDKGKTITISLEPLPAMRQVKNSTAATTGGGMATPTTVAFKLAEDTVWKGTCHWKSGPMAGNIVAYEFHVDSRKGAAFRGHIIVKGAKSVRLSVDGTIQGESVTWTEEGGADNKIRRSAAGTIRGNAIRAVVTREGGGREGELELTLASPADADFHSLFNGKDLTSWEPFPGGTAKWTVEDGCIVGRGGRGLLFSKRGNFTDFDVRVQAKASPATNSGLFFRMPFTDVVRSGYEAQIDAGVDPYPTGSLYALVTAPRDLMAPNEWFTMEVIAEGPHIRTFVNGKRGIDFKDATPRSMTGFFALQAHSPKGEIRFRKIEVKELK